MWSPLLTVASFAINITIGTVTCNNRIKGFCAILAFVAFTMPFTSLGKDLFSSKNYTTTTWATLTFGSLDCSSIITTDPRCMFTIFVENIKKIRIWILAPKTRRHDKGSLALISRDQRIRNFGISFIYIDNVKH